MASSGNLLGDRYRLDDRIAAGGMGEVWRATDIVLGRTVAVKMLHDARATDREFQTRFHHEARAMAALRHPGIAGVYDYGQIRDGGGAYIVMAYIDGQPLDKQIAEAGRLDAGTAMSVVAQAAHALAAAHAAGIVHRDVKPGNLIVQPDGDVVLVDFGVARSAGLAAITGTNEVVGTALYIAPEQVSKQTTGPATDIYALGAVAYHCVAGRPPFTGNSPVAVAMHHLADDPPPLPADVPAPVRELIGTAMAKQPDERYPSAATMAAAAESAAAASSPVGGPAGAPEPAGGVAAAGPAALTGAGATTRLMVADGPAGEPTGRAPRRSTALWMLALLAAIALAVAITLGGPGTVFRDPDPKPTPTTHSGPTGTGPGGEASPGPAGGSGAPGAPGAPGASAPTAGNGETTPRTGGSATQPGGGGTTTQDPQPTPAPPTPEATAPAQEQTVAPAVTGSA